MTPETPPLPPEIERRLRDLSQPGARADDYILAPPPVRSGPDLDEARSRAAAVAIASADRSLAALAHFTILFGVLGFTLPISLAVTAVIWINSRRSPFVHFHAKQAGAYQLFVIVSHIGFAVLWGLLLSGSVYFHWDWTTRLAAILPFVWLLWFLGTILYGGLAGLLVLLGKDFRYPLFGRGPRYQ